MSQVITVKKTLRTRKPIPHKIHSERTKKNVLTRLARSLGHLESVKRMVTLDADAPEILIQLAAVKNEIAALSKLILQDHYHHCLAEVVEKKDATSIATLDEAINQLLK